MSDLWLILEHNTLSTLDLKVAANGFVRSFRRIFQKLKEDKLLLEGADRYAALLQASAFHRGFFFPLGKKWVFLM